MPTCAAEIKFILDTSRAWFEKPLIAERASGDGRAFLCALELEFEELFFELFEPCGFIKGERIAPAWFALALSEVTVFLRPIDFNLESTVRSNGPALGGLFCFSSSLNTIFPLFNFSEEMQLS